MDRIVATLLSKLADPQTVHPEIISWGAPVPAFGDVTRSRVATLGLNPSNREFVDHRGTELHGASRRFHTLRSLGLKTWADARNEHIELIVESCKGYFGRNPYDSWFRQLDFIISGTRASYYDEETSACHLDLIPFATERKWTALTGEHKKALFRAAKDDLLALLQASPINLIVLNGQSVVRQFQEVFAIDLAGKEMPNWSLRRGATRSVAGHAYMGRLQVPQSSGSVRELVVLGFNHNIQSSFGVTKEVRASIRDWVTQASQSVKP